MMKSAFNLHIVLCFICSVILLSACQKAGVGVKATGSEYMPDMAHSVAYEANYYNYYYNNTWGTEDEYYEYAKPRLPVPGTVPHAGPGAKAAASSVYMYGDTEEERTRATNEIINNPHKITDEGLARGKELYNVFCAVCHGTKGDGAGSIVESEIYPVQPANFLLEEFLNASNGRYYHSIMYGKNLMGSYKDKMSTEERWQVIHYIRSLQAKELKKVYNQTENTLNNIDVPAGEIVMMDKEEMHDAGNHDAHGHDGHGHDDDHGHGHETDEHSGGHGDEHHGDDHDHHHEGDDKHEHH